MPLTPEFTHTVEQACAALLCTYEGAYRVRTVVIACANCMSWSMLSEFMHRLMAETNKQALFHFQVIPGNATLIFDVELLSFSGK